MFQTPDYHAHDEFKIRSEKLQKILDLKVDPYPAKWTPEDKAGGLEKNFQGHEVGPSEAAEEGRTPHAKLAGRLVLFRPMGKNAFGHLQDDTGRIQVMFSRDLTSVANYTPQEEELSAIKFIEKLIDLGDILGVEGHLFRTRKGELTLLVRQVTLLCKTLLPLPDKHAGLADKEVRYRKRWLDLITNQEVANTFRIRATVVRMLRQALHEANFVEVETPVLQSIYGGAAAKPFLTELHSLKQSMFLRISLEISLKKLIVGGMERIFEMGRVFRNEGIDRNHNPEFTLLEAYAAYWDYRDMMHLMETLCEKIAIELHGSSKVVYEDVTIDFKAPWKRLTLKEAIQEYAQISVDHLSDEELKKTVLARTDLDPLRVNKASRGLMIAFLFEELVEKKLIQPHHILDYPIETTPLCKPHRDPKLRKEGLVERFESYILGHEVCNAYSELNDPMIQRKLLVDQAMRREEGDEEASPLDEEFLEAVCQGMPPCGGIGMGVDRLVMLFSGVHSIRDVLYFPFLKNIQ